jgi:hypothetical protein
MGGKKPILFEKSLPTSLFQREEFTITPGGNYHPLAMEEIPPLGKGG